MQTTARQESSATQLQDNLYCLHAEHVPMFWDEIEPVLDRAMKYANGKFSTPWIYEQACAGMVLIWIRTNGRIESVAVSRVENYPHKRVLNVLFAAGRLDRMPEDLVMLERHGKDMDCDAVEIWGRPGWRKVFQEYKVIHTVLSKKL